MTGPFVLAAVLAATQAPAHAPRLVDGFERVAGWTAHPADGVTLTLRSDAGHRGRAMRLDFAFAGGGYAIARNEVVWRDRSAGRFIGDLPHTWVGSDFLRSAADLFAYERESDRAVVVAAGIPAAWLAEPGTSVRGLSTWWGRLSFTARQDSGAVTIRIEAGLRVPPGGVVVTPPLAAGARAAFLDARLVPLDSAGTVTVRRLPAEVRFVY